jgi:hypothetical protein
MNNISGIIQDGSKLIDLEEQKKILRVKIEEALKRQGFTLDRDIGSLRPNKEVLKMIQQSARLEQIELHKSFLLQNFGTVKKFSKSGAEIVPERISLELRIVERDSLEDKIFKWWNLVWWSIPYQHPYGRQMRFLIWDKGNDAPFGMFSLQSPVLKMKVRDEALGIPNDELDLWVNRSMYAQRVGAFPPYNDLLGGKAVALSLTSNEVRNAYKEKYKNRKTIIKNRFIDSELLFITTTSAFGRSSLYNRLTYNKEIVAESLGYTKGSGTFQIPEGLYKEILNYLERKGIDTRRSFGFGPSKKIKLLTIALKDIGIPEVIYHGIKREFYIFPLVSNLREVISGLEEPKWFDRPFEKLAEYWKERWALPRAKRSNSWKKFDKNEFFEEVSKMLKEKSYG